MALTRTKKVLAEIKAEQVSGAIRTHLTKTEIEILQTVVTHNATNANAIAEALGYISPRTASTHITNINAVLGTSSLLGAVLIALKTGQISLGYMPRSGQSPSN